MLRRERGTLFPVALGFQGFRVLGLGFQGRPPPKRPESSCVCRHEKGPLFLQKRTSAGSLPPCFFLLFRRHATLDRERMLRYSQYRTRHTQSTQNCTHSAMPTMSNRNCSREAPGCGLHTVAKEDGKAGNCGNTRSSLPIFKDQRRLRKFNMM